MVFINCWLVQSVSFSDIFKGFDLRATLDFTENHSSLQLFEIYALITEENILHNRIRDNSRDYL